MIKYTTSRPDWQEHFLKSFSEKVNHIGQKLRTTFYIKKGRTLEKE